MPCSGGRGSLSGDAAAAAGAAAGAAASAKKRRVSHFLPTIEDRSMRVAMFFGESSTCSCLNSLGRDDPGAVLAVEPCGPRGPGRDRVRPDDCGIFLPHSSGVERVLFLFSLWLSFSLSLGLPGLLAGFTHRARHLGGNLATLLLVRRARGAGAYL